MVFMDTNAFALLVLSVNIVKNETNFLMAQMNAKQVIMTVINMRHVSILLMVLNADVKLVSMEMEERIA